MSETAATQDLRRAREATSIWYRLTFIAMIAFCVFIRLLHATTECRISWDEGRPSVERVIEQPWRLVDELEHSWGRPGTVAAKMVALIVYKALRKCGVAGNLPEWTPFQIMLDVSTLLLLSRLTWNIVGETPSKHVRWQVMLAAAALWAFSPGCVYWSLRFMPPVYAACGLAVTLLLLQAALTRGPGTWFAAGVAAGMTFLIYPGAYAILGSLALTYSITQLSLRKGWGVLVIAFFGGVTPVVLMEVGIRLAFIRLGRTGYGFVAQLSDLKNTINHGRFADAPYAIAQYACNLDDYVVLLLGLLCVMSAICVRWGFRPVSWAFVMTYGYWVVNSAVLHREVIYDRMLVLLTPLAIAGYSEVMSRLSRTRLSNKAVIALALCTSIGATASGLVAICRWDRVRVHEVDLKRFASHQLGVPAMSLIVLGEFQDYGETVSAHATSLKAKILEVKQAHPDSIILVAFNLRSDYFVRVPPEASAYERLSTVLRFPKHCTGRQCKGMTCVTPCMKDLPNFSESWSDIKVYLAEDLLSQFP